MTCEQYVIARCSFGCSWIERCTWEAHADVVLQHRDRCRSRPPGWNEKGFENTVLSTVKRTAHEHTINVTSLRAMKFGDMSPSGDLI